MISSKQYILLFIAIICSLTGCDLLNLALPGEPDDSGDIEETTEETTSYYHNKRTRVIKAGSGVFGGASTNTSEAVQRVEEQIAFTIENYNISSDPAYQSVAQYSRQLKISASDLVGIEKAIRYAAAFDLERLDLGGCPKDYVKTVVRVANALQAQIQNMHLSVYLGSHGRDMSNVIRERNLIVSEYQKANNNWLLKRTEYTSNY